MAFNIEKAIKILQNLGYQNINNLNILKEKNILFNKFKKLLENHKIYKLFLIEKEKKNIDFILNEECIKEIINTNKYIKIKDIDKKLNNIEIITFIIGNKYKNKIKKLRRFLKRFYITNTNNIVYGKHKYIIKLKWGYITMSQFKRDLIDYIIENNLHILYFKELENIMEFLNSKFSINNISEPEIFIFIKKNIMEIYNIFNNSRKKNNNIMIFELSDTINYIKESLDNYITKYNENKLPLDRLPYFTNFKGNSDGGYYYLFKYRAYGWDIIYNNRNLEGDSLEILKRIDKNTKYNTLISLYIDIIPNNINKEELKMVIEDYSNKKFNTTLDYINKCNLLNIPTNIIVDLCQTYYTHSLVFEIYRKIFIDKLIYNQKIKKIIIIQNWWKQIYYAPKTLIGEKRLVKEMTELFDI